VTRQNSYVALEALSLEEILKKVPLFLRVSTSGAFISLVFSTEVPFAKAIVPGHPFMNYLSILFVVEIIIAALMHIKATGKTTALSFSESISLAFDAIGGNE